MFTNLMRIRVLISYGSIRFVLSIQQRDAYDEMEYVVFSDVHVWLGRHFGDLSRVNWLETTKSHMDK